MSKRKKDLNQVLEENNKQLQSNRKYEKRIRKSEEKQAVNNDIDQGIENEYGLYIDPKDIFINNNPLSRDFKKEYIKAYHNDPARNDKSNYGNAQLIGDAKKGHKNSNMFPGRSKGTEYGQDWVNHVKRREKKEKNNDKYGNKSNKSLFDSERVGFLLAYEDFLLKNRQNGTIPYDVNARHSVDNLRRVRSPSPQRQKQINNEENYRVLAKLSGPKKRYGENLDKTFAEIIKEGLEKNNVKVHMLSERPACNHPDTIGCKQFLPTLMPKNSFYGYTRVLRDELKKEFEKNFPNEKIGLNTKIKLN